MSDIPTRFRCIVVDPPWRTTTGPQWKPEDNGHKKLSYPIMTLNEIKSLPVDDLAEEAAYLFLWTTNILVRKAYDVVEAWGFKPSVLLTWAKNPLGMGLGDAFGITTEHVLFAHRGGFVRCAGCLQRGGTGKEQGTVKSRKPFKTWWRLYVEGLTVSYLPGGLDWVG